MDSLQQQRRCKKTIKRPGWLHKATPNNK